MLSSVSRYLEPVIKHSPSFLTYYINDDCAAGRTSFEFEIHSSAQALLFVGKEFCSVDKGLVYKETVLRRRWGSGVVLSAELIS